MVDLEEPWSIPSNRLRDLRVFLISPPYRRPQGEHLSKTWAPLGIAYLAAVLRMHGAQVRVLDAVAEELTVDQVVAEAEAFRPDILGVSVVAATYGTAVEIGRRAKAWPCPPLVVAGGPHVTFDDGILRTRAVDVVVRGEGEVTLWELACCVKAGRPIDGTITGISYLEGEEVLRTPDRPLIDNLDQVPFPAWDLLPMDRYTYKHKQVASLVSSRGCTFTCAYCNEPQMWRRRWRARSPENVVDELQRLVAAYQPSLVLFLDDMFTMDKQRAREICREIRRRNLSLRWGCQTRVDRVDPDLMAEMKAAGCTTIGFGVESSDPEILARAGRYTPPELIRDSIRAAQRLGIRTIGYFIIGLPGDTEETIDRTIDFALELNLDEAWFTALSPYPGTPFYEHAEEYGLQLNSIDWSDFDFSAISCVASGLTEEVIRAKRAEAYKRFYQQRKRETLAPWNCTNCR